MRTELPASTEWSVVPSMVGFSVVRSRSYFDRMIIGAFYAKYLRNKAAIDLEKLRRAKLVLGGIQ